MAESSLKGQAERMGLQVGRKITLERVERGQGTATKVTLIGRIIELCPYVFIAEMQGKREKTKESFQYGQVVLTKEVRLCKEKDQQKNRGYF